MINRYLTTSIFSLVPLSDIELNEEVKKSHLKIKQNEIYGIIQDNEIKNNKNYASFVFRNKKQEDEYELNGILPKGIPSIYKLSVVELIVSIYKNDYKL